MLRVARSFLAISLCSNLPLLVFSQTTPTSVERPEVVYTKNAVEWPAPVPDGGLLLTVSGPQNLHVRQECPAGNWARFSLIDEGGQTRPDGVYKWELVVQAGWEAVVESGWFEIQGGRPVAEGTGEPQAVVVEVNAPENSLYVDSQGRVGVGTSVPESQLHLKGTTPTFTLEDTTAGGGAFTLRALEKGDGSFGLFDQMTGEARWLIDREGRMGINTTTPTSTFTVDGYIEATKGFLVDGRPLRGFGLVGGSQPLYLEGVSNSLFGTNAGNGTMTGTYNSFFGVDSGSATTSGAGNTFMGWGAGKSNSSGNDNSFFGAGAGVSNTASRNSFFGQNAGNLTTTGSYNSFFGQNAGRANVTGSDNSFFGVWAGEDNVSNQNSFFGAYAGRDNTTGYANSFFGTAAGSLNTTGNSNSVFGAQAGGWYGSENSFFGAYAGNVNFGGSDNVFFGYYAGQGNHTGSDNSFVGAYAGSDNDSGYDNVFLGRDAGRSNTTGYQNSFLGRSAGYANTVETGNTFLGYLANLNPGGNPGTNPVTNATAVGHRAYVAQSNSLVLGSIAGVNGAGSYINVGIGTTTPARQLHLAGANAVFRMDRTTDTASFILVRTDPSGATPWKTFVVGTNASGLNQGEFIINDIGSAVGGGGNRRMTISNDGSVTFTGQVYAAGFTPTSSRAFKTNIRTFENALDTVNRLRGVRFDWKESGTPAVGLIAEEVDEVVPEVVAHENGTAKGVNYANLVAVLVEAVKEQQAIIQEERRRNEEQQHTIARQQKDFDSLKSEVETLKALLGK